MRHFIASLLFVILSWSCGGGSSKLALSENEVPNLWAQLTLDLTKNTPANSPTFASRAFAYVGLTMYESRNKKGTREKQVQRQKAAQVADYRCASSGDPLKTTLSLPAMNRHFIIPMQCR